MDSEQPTHWPGAAALALLSEVDTAVALVGLARITSGRETVQRLLENTRLSYHRVLQLLPAGLALLTPEQEQAIHTRLRGVREWLISTELASANERRPIR